MSYRMTFSGVIVLSRELTLGEARFLLSVSSGGEAVCPAQPIGRLQWVPTDDMHSIMWDGREASCEYVAWMEWLCADLANIGIVGNGEIAWAGEEPGDVGRIFVVNNKVSLWTRQRINPTSDVPLTMAGLGLIALGRAIAGGAK